MSHAFPDGVAALQARMAPQNTVGHVDIGAFSDGNPSHVVVVTAHTPTHQTITASATAPTLAPTATTAPAATTTAPIHSESTTFDLHKCYAQLTKTANTVNVEGKDAVFFVGNTRTGKTTTALLCGGYTVQRFQNEYSTFVAGVDIKRHRDVIDTIDPRVVNPISHGSDACTKGICEIGTLGGTSTVLIDMAGYNDTEGPELDVAHGIIVASTLRSCASARLVVVVSEKDMEGEAGGLCDLLRTLDSYFHPLQDHLPAMTFVFTRLKPSSDYNTVLGHLATLSEAHHVQQSPLISPAINFLIPFVNSHKAAVVLQLSSYPANGTALNEIIMASLPLDPQKLTGMPISEENCLRLFKATADASTRLFCALDVANFKAACGDYQILSLLNSMVPLQEVQQPFAKAHDAVRTDISRQFQSLDSAIATLADIVVLKQRLKQLEEAAGLAGVAGLTTYEDDRSNLLLKLKKRIEAAAVALVTLHLQPGCGLIFDQLQLAATHLTEWIDRTTAVTYERVRGHLEQRLTREKEQCMTYLVSLVGVMGQSTALVVCGSAAAPAGTPGENAAVEATVVATSAAAVAASAASAPAAAVGAGVSAVGAAALMATGSQAQSKKNKTKKKKKKNKLPQQQQQQQQQQQPAGGSESLQGRVTNSGASTVQATTSLTSATATNSTPVTDVPSTIVQACDLQAARQVAEQLREFALAHLELKQHLPSALCRYYETAVEQLHIAMDTANDTVSKLLAEVSHHRVTEAQAQTLLHMIKFCEILQEAGVGQHLATAGGNLHVLGTTLREQFLAVAGQVIEELEQRFVMIEEQTNRLPDLFGPGDTMRILVQVCQPVLSAAIVDKFSSFKQRLRKQAQGIVDKVQQHVRALIEDSTDPGCSLRLGQSVARTDLGHLLRGQLEVLRSFIQFDVILADVLNEKGQKGAQGAHEHFNEARQNLANHWADMAHRVQVHIVSLAASLTASNGAMATPVDSPTLSSTPLQNINHLNYDDLALTLAHMERLVPVLDMFSSGDDQLVNKLIGPLVTLFLNLCLALDPAKLEVAELVRHVPPMIKVMQLTEQLKDSRLATLAASQSKLNNALATLQTWRKDALSTATMFLSKFNSEEVLGEAIVSRDVVSIAKCLEGLNWLMELNGYLESRPDAVRQDAFSKVAAAFAQAFDQGKQSLATPDDPKSALLAEEFFQAAISVNLQEKLIPQLELQSRLEELRSLRTSNMSQALTYFQRNLQDNDFVAVGEQLQKFSETRNATVMHTYRKLEAKVVGHLQNVHLQISEWELSDAGFVRKVLRLVAAATRDFEVIDCPAVKDALRKIDEEIDRQVGELKADFDKAMKTLRFQEAEKVLGKLENVAKAKDHKQCRKIAEWKADVANCWTEQLYTMLVTDILPLMPAEEDPAAWVRHAKIDALQKYLANLGWSQDHSELLRELLDSSIVSGVLQRANDHVKSWIDAAHQKANEARRREDFDCAAQVASLLMQVADFTIPPSLKQMATKYAGVQQRAVQSRPKFSPKKHSHELPKLRDELVRAERDRPEDYYAMQEEIDEHWQTKTKDAAGALENALASKAGIVNALQVLDQIMAELAEWTLVLGELKPLAKMIQDIQVSAEHRVFDALRHALDSYATLPPTQLAQCTSDLHAIKAYLDKRERQPNVANSKDQCLVRDMLAKLGPLLHTAEKMCKNVLKWQKTLAEFDVHQINTMNQVCSTLGCVADFAKTTKMPDELNRALDAFVNRIGACAAELKRGLTGTEITTGLEQHRCLVESIRLMQSLQTCPLQLVKEAAKVVLEQLISLAKDVRRSIGDTLASLIEMNNADEFNQIMAHSRIVDDEYRRIEPALFSQRLEAEIATTVTTTLRTLVRGADERADLPTLARDIIAVKQHVRDITSSYVQGAATVLIQELMKPLSDEDLNNLGCRLCELGALGQEVVASMSEFQEVERKNFHEATAKMSLDHAIQELRQKNQQLSESRAAKLRDLYEAYDTLYEAHLKEYVFSQHRRQLSKLTENLKQQARQLRTSATYRSLMDSIPELLAGIFCVWSATSLKLKPAVIPQRKSLLTPHPVQVLAIMRMLSLDEEESKSWLGRLGRAISGLLMTEEYHPPGHVVELQTGQGKSVLLGALASLLALLGYEVQVACYSEYLSTRDGDAFAELFGELDVKHLIHYDTIRSVIEREINAEGNLRAIATHIVTDRGLDKSQLQANETCLSPRRVLLFDEVDVFLSDSFFGSTYNPVASITNDHVVALLRYIYEHRKVVRFDMVAAQPAYKALLHLWGEGVQPLLDRELCEAVADSKTFSQQKYHLDTHGQRIGYPREDGISYSLTCGYKTSFHYLEAEASGRLSASPSESKYLALKISCGSFAYALMAKSFCSVMGVTGTLASLSVEEKALFEEYCNISEKRMTVAPSIYATESLDFRSAEATHVQVAPTRAAHHQLILEAIKGALDKGGSSGTGVPVVVYFEDAERLDEFEKSEYGIRLKGMRGQGKVKVQHLSEATAHEDKQHIIRLAMDLDVVTLSVRALARGIDYRCFDSGVNLRGGAMVIQTFFSKLVTEEIQTKGRTARQGKNGAYRLLMCAEDVMKEFKLTQADLDAAKARGVYDALCDVRKKATIEFVKSLKQKAEQAQKRHANSVLVWSRIKASIASLGNAEMGRKTISTAEVVKMLMEF